MGYSDELNLSLLHISGLSYLSPVVVQMSGVYGVLRTDTPYWFYISLPRWYT